MVAVKWVNELGYYSLGLNDLADKIKVTAPKTLALVKELKLQEDADFVKAIRIGSVEFKRYNAKALFSYAV